MDNLGIIFNIYDILGTTVGSNSSVTAKIGNIHSNNDSYSQNAQVWSITGLASLPAPVSDTKDCAQAISIARHDQDIIFATRDTRYQSSTSDISAGDIYLYSTGPAATSAIKVKSNNIIDINGNTINIDATTVNINTSTVPLSTTTNIGSSPTPLTKAAFSEALMAAVLAFATAAVNDPLLLVLCPVTWAGANALLTTLTTLTSNIAVPSNVFITWETNAT